MNLRTLAAASALAGVGYLLGLSTSTSTAQQTFLPSDFQAGATFTLNRRAEKCASGDGLTISAPARVVRTPVRNQLGVGGIRIAVSNQRLRGWARAAAHFSICRPALAALRGRPRCSAVGLERPMLDRLPANQARW